MKVKELLAGTRLNKSVAQLNACGISFDSRSLKKNDLFFVRGGNNFDVFSALVGVQTRCLCFVADKKDKLKITQLNLKKTVIFVDNIQVAFEAAVDKFYGYEKDYFKVIAVTGTNGKTTITHCIYSILRKLNVGAALLGTVAYFINDKKFSSTHTTPDYLYLRKFLAECRRKKVRYIVIEVSSHAIAQQRVKGLNFVQCIFTNLTRDHLDYHKTMINYFKTKRKLFIDNPSALKIINYDDKYGKKLSAEVKAGKTFSIGDDKSKAGFLASGIKFSRLGSSFVIKGENIGAAFETRLIGRHNLSNLVSAILSVSSLGYPIKKIAQIVSSYNGVSGRLEEVCPGIYVDYAHTPDALAAAILSLKQAGFAKVITLFGCGGNRDKGKRLMMGEVSCKLSDFTIVTSDNPRWEDPEKICLQIVEGFKNKRYTIIVDRKNAIKKAIEKKRFKKDTALLIAGKGHETYQIIGDKRIDFTDRDVVKSICRAGRIVTD